MRIEKHRRLRRKWMLKGEKRQLRRDRAAIRRAERSAEIEIAKTEIERKGYQRKRRFWEKKSLRLTELERTIKKVLKDYEPTAADIQKAAIKVQNLAGLLMAFRNEVEHFNKRLDRHKQAVDSVKEFRG